jgi:hypothetical protein
MRKKCTAARWLIAQACPKCRSVDRDQNQIAAAGEMPRRRLGDLRGCGKVDEAVGVVDRRTGEFARPLGLVPESGRTDLVDGCVPVKTPVRFASFHSATSLIL